MTICIIVASIMAFLSFFFLLSPSYYNYTNYYDNPLIINHVMESNSKIEFKMVFALQIIIMVVSLILIFLAIKTKNAFWNERYVILLSIAAIGLSIALTVMIFKAQAIVQKSVDARGINKVVISIAWKVYAASHIIIAVTLFLAILFRILEPVFVKSKVHNLKRIELKLHRNPTEYETIDLLIKYKNMVDEGEITLEEFINKKRELLK